MEKMQDLYKNEFSSFSLLPLPILHIKYKINHSKYKSAINSDDKSPFPAIPTRLLILPAEKLIAIVREIMYLLAV